MAVNGRVPAWKRVGLKLKGADVVVDAQPDLHPGTKRSRNVLEQSLQPESQNNKAKRPRAVAFADDTKREDGKAADLSVQDWFGSYSEQDAPAESLPKKPKSPGKGATKSSKPGHSMNGASSDSERGYVQYLKQYETDPTSWKFNKSKQNALLKHATDVDSVPEDLGEALQAYVSGLKGTSARERLKTSASEVLKSTKSVDDEIEPEDGETATITSSPTDQALALRRQLQRNKERLRLLRKEVDKQSEESVKRLRKRNRAVEVLLALASSEAIVKTVAAATPAPRTPSAPQKITFDEEEETALQRNLDVVSTHTSAAYGEMPGDDSSDVSDVSSCFDLLSLSEGTESETDSDIESDIEPSSDVPIHEHKSVTSTLEPPAKVALVQTIDLTLDSSDAETEEHSSDNDRSDDHDDQPAEMPPSPTSRNGATTNSLASWYAANGIDPQSRTPSVVCEPRHDGRRSASSALHRRPPHMHALASLAVTAPSVNKSGKPPPQTYDPRNPPSLKEMLEKGRSRSEQAACTRPDPSQRREAARRLPITPYSSGFGVGSSSNVYDSTTGVSGLAALAAARGESDAGGRGRPGSRNCKHGRPSLLSHGFASRSASRALPLSGAGIGGGSASTFVDILAANGALPGALRNSGGGRRQAPSLLGKRS